MLLQHRADTRLKNKSGQTALMVAAANNHLNVVLALLRVDKVFRDQVGTRGGGWWGGGAEGGAGGGARGWDGSPFSRSPHLFPAPPSPPPPPPFPPPGSIPLPPAPPPLPRPLKPPLPSLPSESTGTTERWERRFWTPSPPHPTPNPSSQEHADDKGETPMAAAAKKEHTAVLTALQEAEEIDVDGMKTVGRVRIFANALIHGLLGAGGGGLFGAKVAPSAAGKGGGSS